MNVDEARKFLHSDARKEYSECRRAAVAYDAEIDRLHGLLREWFNASDPSIGGSPGSLLERTRAALSGPTPQPSVNGRLTKLLRSASHYVLQFAANESSARKLYNEIKSELDGGKTPVIEPTSGQQNRW